MSMSDHIFWFAMDISWATFGRLDVGGHGPLHLLVCSENAFSVTECRTIFNGNKANCRFFVVDKGIFQADSLITKLSKLKLR